MCNYLVLPPNRNTGLKEKKQFNKWKALSSGKLTLVTDVSGIELIKEFYFIFSFKQTS